MPFLDELNPQQREAVETADGSILILAGAGSGKTRVITYRIAHLIEQLGVQPEAILAVTFTNKAASEMAERVEHLVGGRSFAKPWISTFHSMCVRMLRRDIEALRVNNVGYRKDFAIYDEADQQALVKQAIRRLGLDDKQLTPRSVLARISWAKNHMLDPQETFLQSSDLKSEQVAHVYEIYRQELRKANAMDFDDLLLETVRLLKVAEPVRHYWNRRFQYILIDEYQDTNRPQYELMRLLAGERHNICAVGDEDQSIYSWRGADIRNILEFEKDFGDAKIIRLEQNYRSTQNILSAASAVVANNVKRKGKNLWTSRQGGNNIGYYEAPDGENEALFAADLFSKYLQQSAQEGMDEARARAAVLYRTNAQSRLFEEAMRRYQLPYHVVGGFSFYERAEIKDMISYLKVVQNPDDSIALLRVINTPARGIGRTTLDTLERIGLETGTSLWGAIGNAIDGVLVPPRAVASLKNFRDIIEGGRAMLAGNYAQWLGDSTDESPSEPEDRTAPDAEAVWHGSLTRDPEADESFDFGANLDIVQSDSDISDANSLSQPVGPGALADHDSDLGAVGPGALAGAASEDAENPDAEGAPARGSDPRPGTTAELLKYLLDRTGYIKQLEEEDTPESLGPHREPARTGERRHGFARPRRVAAGIPRSRRAGQRPGPVRRRRQDHAHDPALRQGPGVSPGVPGRHGGGPVPALADVPQSRRCRGRAPPLLRRHDPRHGPAHRQPRALPPPLRHRYAGGLDRVALPRGDSAAVAGRPGRAAAFSLERNRSWGTRARCGTRALACGIR